MTSQAPSDSQSQFNQPAGQYDPGAPTMPDDQQSADRQESTRRLAGRARPAPDDASEP